MTTFSQFLENKKNSNLIRECAQLLAERDVDPYVYIYESLKEFDPVLAEGFWDGVKATAGNIWQGVKQVGSSLWDGGGLKHGLKQASDTIAGPVAKFDAAERALNDLVKVLNSDPRFKKFKSSAPGMQGQPVSEYIARVLASLGVDKAQIPQLMQTQVKQNYGTRQDVEAQNQPAAAPAPAPAAQPLSAAAPAAKPSMKRTGTG